MVFLAHVQSASVTSEHAVSECVHELLFQTLMFVILSKFDQSNKSIPGRLRSVLFLPDSVRLGFVVRAGKVVGFVVCFFKPQSQGDLGIKTNGKHKGQEHELYSHHLGKARRKLFGVPGLCLVPFVSS